MLRIIAGKLRSRLLLTPDAKVTKPTMDRVRSGVFSALGDEIIDKCVLDLFAGAGSYGFEAISRGAKKAIFIDNDKEAYQILKANTKTLNLSDDVEIIYGDAFKFLKTTSYTIDIIFVDPPYKKYDYREILDEIINSSILSEKGIVILESETELDIEENIFTKIKKYKYGLAKIYILRK